MTESGGGKKKENKREGKKVSEIGRKEEDRKSKGVQESGRKWRKGRRKIIKGKERNYESGGKGEECKSKRVKKGAESEDKEEENK